MVSVSELCIGSSFELHSRISFKAAAADISCETISESCWGVHPRRGWLLFFINTARPAVRVHHCSIAGLEWLWCTATKGTTCSLEWAAKTGMCLWIHPLGFEHCFSFFVGWWANPIGNNVKQNYMPHSTSVLLTFRPTGGGMLLIGRVMSAVLFASLNIDLWSRAV